MKCPCFGPKNRRRDKEKYEEFSEPTEGLPREGLPTEESASQPSEHSICAEDSEESASEPSEHSICAEDSEECASEQQLSSFRSLSESDGLTHELLRGSDNDDSEEYSSTDKDSTQIEQDGPMSEQDCEAAQSGERAQMSEGRDEAPMTFSVESTTRDTSGAGKGHDRTKEFETSKEGKGNEAKIVTSFYTQNEHNAQNSKDFIALSVAEWNYTLDNLYKDRYQELRSDICTPQHIERGSKHTERGSKHTERGSKHTERGSKHTERGSKRMSGGSKQSKKRTQRKKWQPSEKLHTVSERLSKFLLPERCDDLKQPGEDAQSAVESVHADSIPSVDSSAWALSSDETTPSYSRHARRPTRLSAYTDKLVSGDWKHNAKLREAAWKRMPVHTVKPRTDTGLTKGVDATRKVTPKKLDGAASTSFYPQGAGKCGSASKRAAKPSRGSFYSNRRARKHSRIHSKIPPAAKYDIYGRVSVNPTPPSGGELDLTPPRIGQNVRTPAPEPRAMDAPSQRAAGFPDASTPSLHAARVCSHSPPPRSPISRRSQPAQAAQRAPRKPDWMVLGAGGDDAALDQRMAVLHDMRMTVPRGDEVDGWNLKESPDEWGEPEMTDATGDTKRGSHISPPRFSWADASDDISDVEPIHRFSRADSGAKPYSRESPWFERGSGLQQPEVLSPSTDARIPLALSMKRGPKAKVPHSHAKPASPKATLGYLKVKAQQRDQNLPVETDFGGYSSKLAVDGETWRNPNPNQRWKNELEATPRVRARRSLLQSNKASPLGHQNHNPNPNRQGSSPSVRTDLENRTPSRKHRKSASSNAFRTDRTPSRNLRTSAISGALRTESRNQESARRKLPVACDVKESSPAVKHRHVPKATHKPHAPKLVQQKELGRGSRRSPLWKPQPCAQPAEPTPHRIVDAP